MRDARRWAEPPFRHRQYGDFYVNAGLTLRSRR